MLEGASTEEGSPQGDDFTTSTGSLMCDIVGSRLGSPAPAFQQATPCTRKYRDPDDGGSTAISARR